ncbi:fimbrial protein [Klebsiella grimontii]|uniref:fimbrial protein n=1 Tax=Klebsiella grimontii TaxID=2058152 RepID=UPI00104F2A22|nr:fimbrial protein [Klebsiella grimontii]TCZ55663.1 type 1 fimbrial protein [Klebsiella grimontii]
MMKIIIFVICMFISLKSFANCNLPPLFNGYVSLKQVLVQRDLPIGSVIATVTDTFNIPNRDTMYICTGNITVSYLMVGNHTRTSYEDVYTTNIPGVGVKIQASAFIANRFLSIPASTYSYRLTVGQFYPWSISMTFSLIKIGDISSGTFATGRIGQISAMNNRNVMVPYFNLYVSGDLVVKQTACNVVTKSLTVNLNDILTTRFNSVGTTQGSKPFTISLDCEPGARINVSLNGTPNRETNQQGVLALTSGSDATAADGIGIQVIRDGSPIQLNQNSYWKTANGINDNLDFTARYYQTKQTVTSGVVNATATLTLTYQ